MFKTRDQCRTRAFNPRFQDFFIHLRGQFSTGNHVKARVLDTRFSFLHFLLRSSYSSISPYTSPTDSSNLSFGATTQTQAFIISWHQSKNPNPKITILAPEQLLKLGFVDLGTEVAWVCCGFVDLSIGAACVC